MYNLKFADIKNKIDVNNWKKNKSNFSRPGIYTEIINSCDFI
jgi:hypothetical protein